MTASASSRDPVRPIMENSLPEMVAAARPASVTLWHSIVDRFDPLCCRSSAGTDLARPTVKMSGRPCGCAWWKT